MLKPLSGFVMDVGLSSSEFNAIFRHAAVLSAAERQVDVTGQVNISGIAATTGIPRPDVSRLLRAPYPSSAKHSDGLQQKTNAVLSAWYKNKRFTGEDGLPARLKIYGRGLTFESLGRQYARAFPTRALLDALILSGAVELLSNQEVQAIRRTVVARGINPKLIKEVGERTAELLSSMLSKIRDPDAPQFVACASSVGNLDGETSALQNEISKTGVDFISSMQKKLDSMLTSEASPRPKQNKTQISVTLFYQQSSEKVGIVKKGSGRRNFKRKQ